MDLNMILLNVRKEQLRMVTEVGGYTRLVKLDEIVMPKRALPHRLLKSVGNCKPWC